MTYKKIIALILFLCFLNSIFSQKANTWHFGYGAGLSFNTLPPMSLSGGQTSGPDNSTSISDASGNLLFYTNGVNVWNKNHVQMPNGYGLTGHSSAGQCAIIVPMLCNADKYIIFHVTEYSSPGYLNYTVVDMTLNNGFGDVVTTQKNISLGTGWTEKLCAYYNSASNFYWVFSHKWNSNQYVAFKVDFNSIATQSVVSAIGSIHNCGSYGSVHDAMGQLTISPDGTKLVNALTCQDKYELFDLNINTGTLSNPIIINGGGSSAWGTAFSPDSKKLYVDSYYTQNVLQYDLSVSNSTAIAASQFTLNASANNFGYMELGPDSLVYIAKPGSTSLTVINNPNLPGAGSNFSLSGPSLGTQTSTHGLSRIAYNTPIGNNNPTVTILNSNGNAILCAGQTTTLTASGANTYTWTTNITGSTLVVTPTISTSYSVTGATDACSGMAAITVSVSDCTSLSENVNTEGSFYIYPNPVKDFIHIRLNTSLPVNLNIRNTLGQVIFIKENVNSPDKIDLTFLSNGIYLMEVISGSGTEITKLVKD